MAKITKEEIQDLEIFRDLSDETISKLSEFGELKRISKGKTRF